mgnify:CR=1 FL=1
MGIGFMEVMFVVKALFGERVRSRQEVSLVEDQQLAKIISTKYTVIGLKIRNSFIL